ncbi:DUF4132 domain-containing protein [Gordonia sp. NPDC003950]
MSSSPNWNRSWCVDGSGTRRCSHGDSSAVAPVPRITRVVFAARSKIRNCCARTLSDRQGRIAKDGTPVDADGRVVDFDTDTVIGVAHPMRMGEPAVRRWRRVFDDLGPSQPFEQLRRTVYHVCADTARGTQFDAVTGMVLRVTTQFWRGFPGSSWSITVRIRPGVPRGAGVRDDGIGRQTLDAATLVDAAGARVAPAIIDPALSSEILGELDWLAS